MPSEQPWYIDAAELAEMPFLQAAETWLASRTSYISKKTFHEYKLNIKTLAAYQELPLSKKKRGWTLVTSHCESSPLRTLKPRSPNGDIFTAGQ